MARVLKKTIAVKSPDGMHSAVLTAGLRDDEVQQIAPWALKKGVLPAKGTWAKVKDAPKGDL